MRRIDVYCLERSVAHHNISILKYNFKLVQFIITKLIRHFAFYSIESPLFNSFDEKLTLLMRVLVMSDKCAISSYLIYNADYPPKCFRAVNKRTVLGVKFSFEKDIDPQQNNARRWNK